ncbi:MAG TPA: hypothetical protein VFS76_13505 [Pyrinomonadaceae bacterium]|nr:hypothetical protein [Pyrinomonadaceae bacterium]
MASSKVLAITKEMLIDWLREEVPDGAEMGIDVSPDGHLDLVALSGKDHYALIMGELPNDDDAQTANGTLH